MRIQKPPYSAIVNDYLWGILRSGLGDAPSGWNTRTDRGICYTGSTLSMSWYELCAYCGIFLDFVHECKGSNLTHERVVKPPYAVLGKVIIREKLWKKQGDEDSGWIQFLEDSVYYQFPVKKGDIANVPPSDAVSVMLSSWVRHEKLSWIRFCEEFEIFPRELIDRYK